MQAQTDEEVRLSRMLGYVETDPENIHLLLTIADLQMEIGLIDQAEVHYQRVMTLDPNHGIAIARLSGVRIAQERYDEAEALLTALVSTGVNEPPILHNLGMAQMHQSNWEAALESLKAADEAGLDDPYNLNVQAFCLHQLGTINEALEAAYRAIDLGDLSHRGYVALLHFDAAESTAAKQMAEQVLRENPDDVDANVVVSSCLLESQRMPEAEILIERALKALPHSPRALLNKALLHMYRTEFPEAIASFQKILELAPNSPGIRVWLGWAYLSNDELVAAEQSFLESVEFNGAFAESHGGLATVYALTGRYDEARDAARKARRLNPEGFGAALASAILLEVGGKRQKSQQLVASVLSRRIREDTPTLMEAIEEYARLEMVRDTPAGEAIRSLQRAQTVSGASTREVGTRGPQPSSNIKRRK